GAAIPVPAPAACQAWAARRGTFAGPPPRPPDRAAGRLQEVTRDGRSLFHGEPGPPLRLTYVPSIPLTPFRPVLEGEIQADNGGGLPGGTARPPAGVRVGPRAGAGLLGGARRPRVA